MASSSPGVFIIRGVRISLSILQDVASDLPPPASTIINLAQHIISIIDEVQKNQDDVTLLRDQLLELLPVVLNALKEAMGGKEIEIPTDLKRNVERLQINLEKILADITKVKNVVASKRKRDKIRAVFNSGSHKETLQKCREDLDWAMREFNVVTQLANSVRLLEISSQVKAVSSQVEGVSSQVAGVSSQAQAITTNVDTVLTNSLLEALPRSKRASSTCARPDRPVGCFQGTRTGLLDDIRKWMTNPDSSIAKCFWLSGIAGIGKTTVAYSVAELARSLGILGADFFFSRLGEDELRDPALVIPTLAYQLALMDHEFSRVITATLQSHPDAGFSSIKKQLDTLIIKPLSQLESKPDRIVILVLDAFDECETRGAKEILQLLVAALPSLPFFLKIFITSRPEPHIRSVLVPSDNLHMTALHDAEAFVVKEDIEIYLTARLRGLPKELGLDGIREDWITAEEIRILADAAGTFFIHAATSIRFLTEALGIRKRLNVLLKIVVSSRSTIPPGHLKVFYYLDQLYKQILLDIIVPTNEDEVTALFQPVVGSIALLRDPLPLDALERLVDLDEGDANDLLTRLHSVILPPGPPDYCPRIYHPSFPDFLQNRDRCTDDRLWIQTEKHEARLALRCLDIMIKFLHKNMLGEFDTPLINSDVGNLETKVQAAFPSELRYACLHWPSHLATLPHPEDPVIKEALAVFASCALLPWLESMSWLKRTRDVVRGLEAVNSWVVKSTASSTTINILNDGYRLLLAYFPTITRSALDIAQSVLPFAPRNIQLVIKYADYANSDIRVVTGTESEWSACYMTLTGHSAFVRSVAVSPDGGRIASVSADRTVRIWDASSGHDIAVLEGHSRDVFSVAYSAHGNQIASGSSDRTVLLWDATTGQKLRTLKGHKDTIRSVTFSMDGTRAASGSDDKSIRVWEVITGDCLMTLEGHSEMVHSVAFFPDGKRLVSGSDDCSARIWDVTSGGCVAVLEGLSEAVYSVAVSFDGSRIASGLADDTIRIWNASNGNQLATLRGHEGAVWSVEFSTNGRHIVSASMDGSVRLWDAETCGFTRALKGHSGAVFSAVFTPDGRRLVSGSSDTTIKVWDVNAIDGSTERSSNFEKVASLAFSPGGSRLVSFDWAQIVRVWDTIGGDEVLSFEVKAPLNLWAGWKAEFSSDGTQIIVNHDGKANRFVFDALSGEPVTKPKPPFPDTHLPSQPLFKLEGGRVLHCGEKSLVAFTPPPSLPVSILASSELEGVGYCIAFPSQDNHITIIHVTL